MKRWNALKWNWEDYNDSSDRDDGDSVKDEILVVENFRNILETHLIILTNFLDVTSKTIRIAMCWDKQRLWFL